MRRAFAGIWNDRLIHAVSMGTIAISLLFLGAFALFYVNVSNWVMEWGESVSMSVYLEDAVGPESKKKIERALRSLSGALIKAYVSKEKAMADLKATLGTQAGMLEGLSHNPLPASFEILFKDARRSQLDLRKIKADLEKLKGVSEVQYSEQFQERFEAVMYVLKVAGVVVGLLLCMAVLFIITNTIKLSIYSRREEVEICKLVGASDWFVRAPFLIEGAMEGVIGGVVALLILFLSHFLFSLKEIRVLGLPVIEVTFLPQEYAILIVFLGFLLGLAGSFIAIGRFFRV